jgi:hypothetical protein
MGNNHEAIVNSATATILYWQVEEITAETIEGIPDWVLGLMRATPPKIKMGSSFDMDLLMLKWHAEFQTQFGFKICPAGDFLIYDRGSVYSVTMDEFNQRYTVKPKPVDTRIPEPDLNIEDPTEEETTETGEE